MVHLMGEDIRVFKEPNKEDQKKVEDDNIVVTK